MLKLLKNYMNNYKIIDLLSVLLKRELLYQNNYLRIEGVLFNPAVIILTERNSQIEFTTMEALYTFLSNCLPTTPLRLDRDSLELNREFKENCKLEEPITLIKLSNQQLQEQMKVTPKKVAKTKRVKVTEVKEQAVFLRQKEATELYNADRNKVRRLGEKQIDGSLFYRDDKGIAWYSTTLLDANFEKKAIEKVEEKRENKVVSIEVNGKEIYKAVEKATEPTKEEPIKVKTIDELTKEEKMKLKLGLDKVGFMENELQELNSDLVGMPIKEEAMNVYTFEKIRKGFVKGEVKDFTPNDDDTGEYCQIESSDVELLEKEEEREAYNALMKQVEEDYQEQLEKDLNFLDDIEREKALNRCEIENHNQEENNQESLKEILFYKIIFFNFEDLRFTQKELMKWQKRTSEDTPLSTDEKDKFSLFIQSVRAYSQLIKILENQKIEK